MFTERLFLTQRLWSVQFVGLYAQQAEHGQYIDGKDHPES